MTNSTSKDKAGYEKIRFCGEQARQDGLQYFWVDIVPAASRNIDLPVTNSDKVDWFNPGVPETCG
jgi:hypothetical protein